MLSGVVARGGGDGRRNSSKLSGRTPVKTPSKGLSVKGFSQGKETPISMRYDATTTEEEEVPAKPLHPVVAKAYEWIDYVRSDIFLLTILVYALWLTVGLLYYIHYEQFTWPTAFYYAIEAGLAIGFCSPGDVDDYSKLFTMGFVLAGTTVVSGCMATVILRLLSPGVSILSTVAPEDEYLDIQWPKRPFENWESFKLYLQCIAEHVAVFMRYESNKLFYTQFVVFLIWMGLGCVYGMLVENWTFITSLYWAVTGSSGGGLQSAPCNPGTGGTNADGTAQPLCDMGIRGFIMGLFFMGGVPFYAMTMSNFAFYIARHAIHMHAQRMVRTPVNYDEFLFSANLLSAKGHLSTSLNMGEYVLLNFMRLGVISGDQIVEFRDQFRELDKNDRGVLELKELEELGIVTRRPKRGIRRRGTIDNLLRVLPRSSNIPQKGGVGGIAGGNASGGGDADMRAELGAGGGTGEVAARGVDGSPDSEKVAAPDFDPPSSPSGTTRRALLPHSSEKITSRSNTDIAASVLAAAADYDLELDLDLEDTRGADGVGLDI